MALGLAVFGTLMADDEDLHIAAFALFMAALVTDWVDGYLARQTHSISAFGKVADPIADKILVIGALIALLKTRELEIPLWGVFLIIAREIIVGGVRVLAGAQGKILAADRWGKWKMGIQSGAIALMLLILAYSDRWATPDWVLRLPYHLTVLCVLATWSSAFSYLRQSRSILEKSWS